MEPNPKKSTDPKVNKWGLVNLAMELGFIIALPLVAFALGGKWLDQRIGNDTPWFTLLGVILAITFTTMWLTKRIKELINK
jgi:hypothetical protein